jgi:hypothetical protein
MTRPERLLANVLRLAASFLLLAALAVLLPFPRMDSVHSWLGLGRLPDVPIIHYLTRSLSALYAFHGAIMWGLTWNVQRYGPLIRLLAWGDIVFGMAMFVIDLTAEMPWFWTAAEGPSLVAFGILILWLQRRCARTEPLAL